MSKVSALDIMILLASCSVDVSTDKIVMRGDIITGVACGGDTRSAAASHVICSANSGIVYGFP
jgi:hypothetical protein